MAPSHPAATVVNVEATVASLSESLLSYDHRNWEQVQRDDPQCEAVRPYLQLGCPRPLPPSLCDHIASHKRPDPPDILHLAAQGRLTRGDDDTLLLVHNSTSTSHSGRPPFDDPVRIYVRLLARRQIIHA